MNLSKKCEYALKALIELALHYQRGEDVTLISEIAKKEKIPPRYLEQILLGLKNSGILYSKRGVGGGYALNRAPQAISLGDIIRAVEGPLSSLHSGYMRSRKRQIDDISLAIEDTMKRVDAAIRSEVDGISLTDLTELTLSLKERRESVINYTI